MSRRWRAALVAVLAFGLAGCRDSAAQTSAQAASYSYRPHASVSISYFHDELSPYGRWVDVAPYGECWTPYGVAADWRPYSDGYWAYTDDGWTWVDYAPWGWIPFHYGRWAYDPDIGWLWVPGDVWGPAWVAWRDADDWVGWAPLPPDAEWNVAFGFGFFDFDRIPFDDWCFVQPRHLLDRDLRFECAPFRRNRELFEETHNATRFPAFEGRPFDRGVDRGRIENAVGHSIRPLALRDARGPMRGAMGRARNGTLDVYRPRVIGSGRALGAPDRWRNGSAERSPNGSADRWRNGAADRWRPFGPATPQRTAWQERGAMNGPQRFTRPDQPAWRDRGAFPGPSRPQRPWMGPDRRSPPADRGRAWTAPMPPHRAADPGRERGFGVPQASPQRWRSAPPMERGQGPAFRQEGGRDPEPSRNHDRRSERGAHAP